MSYKDILENELVIKQYNEIDKINPFPFNHGLKHVKNVCNIMNKLCNILEIDEEEKEALLIASALHDIGQVDGRSEHGKKAKLFTITNFEDKLKDNKYYNDILNAIEDHDNVSDISYPLFIVLVQFCDKMDFSKDRLEVNYKDNHDRICYEDIDRVDFIYDDNYFGINIITTNIDDFEEQFLIHHFSKKVLNAVDVLAEKLNKKPVIMNNNDAFKTI